MIERVALYLQDSHDLRDGLDYVKYAERMIDKNIRVNNEFYVCPVYNEAIKDGKKM